MGENGSSNNPSEVMRGFCGNVLNNFVKGDNLLDIHRYGENSMNKIEQNRQNEKKECLKGDLLQIFLRGFSREPFKGSYEV